MVNKLLESASRKAKIALDAGESIEDVTFAVFSELFNLTGMKSELKDWCSDQTKKIMRSLK